jgi:hypothetical protein
MSATTARKTTESKFVGVNAYTFAHGAAPRGYGLWMFQRTVVGEHTNRVVIQSMDWTGTFTEAKREISRVPAPAGFVPLGTGWTVLS